MTGVRSGTARARSRFFAFVFSGVGKCRRNAPVATGGTLLACDCSIAPASLFAPRSGAPGCLLHPRWWISIPEALVSGIFCASTRRAEAFALCNPSSFRPYTASVHYGAYWRDLACAVARWPEFFELCGGMPRVKRRGAGAWGSGGRSDVLERPWRGWQRHCLFIRQCLERPAGHRNRLLSADLSTELCTLHVDKVHWENRVVCRRELDLFTEPKRKFVTLKFFRCCAMPERQ